MKPIGTIRLESPRLQFRRFQKGDEMMMFINYCNTQEVTRYLTWSPHEDLQVTHEFLDAILEKYNDPYFFAWAIIDKKSQQLIGSIDFVKINKNLNEGEIGYVLSEAYWNQGFMSEALNTITNFSFNKADFKRIIIRADARNLASMRVQEKCGYHIDGIEEDVLQPGQKDLIDIVSRSLSKEEYLTRIKR